MQALVAQVLDHVASSTEDDDDLLALRELGQLRSIVGTTILSAAIIDDVLGILVLSVVLAMAGLIFSLPGGQRVRIDGRVLISQPENRISKRMQKTRWKL